MCQRNQAHRNYRNSKKDRPSGKMAFYRNLRSFLMFNLIMAGLWLTGSGLAGLWAVGKIWGIFLAIHYIKISGLPGTNGWLSKDWEAWMEERENRRREEEVESIVGEPESIMEEPEVLRPEWRDRDLV